MKIKIVNVFVKMYDGNVTRWLGELQVQLICVGIKKQNKTGLVN